MSLINDCLKTLRRPDVPHPHPVRTAFTPRPALEIRPILAGCAAGLVLALVAYLIWFPSHSVRTFAPAPAVDLVPPSAPDAARTREPAPPAPVRTKAPVPSRTSAPAAQPAPPAFTAATPARTSAAPAAHPADDPERHFSDRSLANAKAAAIESALTLAWTAGNQTALASGLAALAATLGPDSPNVRQWKGLAAHAAGRYEEAVDIFARICRETPANLQARTALILSLAAAGHRDEARSLLPDLKRDFGDDPSVASLTETLR